MLLLKAYKNVVFIIVLGLLLQIYVLSGLTSKLPLNKRNTLHVCTKLKM